MDYQELIHTIESKRRFGNLPGVTISRKLLAAAGNPQEGLAFIHIAGTNGKGSAAAFLHAVLTESGIHAGLFTSPHLTDFRERIRTGKGWIPKQDAARLGKFLLDLDIGVQPTMFDYCLAMALLYFKEQRCTLAVLETGLGGRLDATNAVGVPLVSIITKIGYDHMEVLGDTLSEIAGEKAGILKKGTRAVFSVQEPEAFETLKQRCDSLEIPFCTVDGTKIVPLESGFCYPDEQAYRMEMPGAYQRENALAAILAARELMGLGYPVTEDALHRGIEKTVWKGRMETICKEPYLLIDGAHNSDGVAALAKSLREMFPGEKFHFIMGVLADKDYRKMAEFMMPLAQKVTAVTPKSERALAAEDLAQYFRKHGIPAESRTDLKEALQPFLEKPVRAGTNERTVAFGSLYFIGEIRDILNLC